MAVNGGDPQGAIENVDGDKRDNLLGFRIAFRDGIIA
jgi:hypothetical protein